jgi:hypothetical protein
MILDRVDLSQVVVKKIRRTDGVAAWVWEAFGADKLLSDGTEGSAAEALEAAARYVRDWCNG